MNSNQFPLLNSQDQADLDDALYYMKMAELKKGCLILSLPDNGKKAQLISRILTWVKEGHIIEAPKIPAQSLSKNHPVQILAPSSLMLHGGYKNDLKTREFFKKLIGSYFHFTAYGIDWLNECWLQGNPPTYQQFADFWKKEYTKRKKAISNPKDEWMFIRFMQQMKKVKEDITQEELFRAWKQLQTQKRNEGFRLLEKASTILR